MLDSKPIKWCSVDKGEIFPSKTLKASPKDEQSKDSKVKKSLLIESQKEMIKVSYHH